MPVAAVAIMRADAMPGAAVDGGRPVSAAWLAIVHMAAIVEGAAVAEAVFADNFTCAVHERDRQPPAALVEIAGSTCVMTRVRHMAATGETTDRSGLVAGGDEIGD